MARRPWPTSLSWAPSQNSLWPPNHFPREADLPGVAALIQNRALHRFAALTGAATILLIFVGGLVTSTGSGLAVPDWPTTYGRFMFAFPLSDMVGGIFYEHGHRLVASLVGLLTLTLAVWLWRTEQRRWVRRLGWVALAVVIGQGLLGGITVLYLLPTPISVFHATLAQTFFLMVILLVYATSGEFFGATGEPAPTFGDSQGIRRWITVSVGLIYVQLVLGAIMRHTGSGLAFLDFPLSGGYLVPTFEASLLEAVNGQRMALELSVVTQGQLLINFAHRLGALAVSVAVVGTVTKTWRLAGFHPGLKRQSAALLAVLVLQIALGAGTVLSGRQALVTSGHVVTGAVLLGLGFLYALRVYHFYPPKPEPVSRPALGRLRAGLDGNL